MATMDIFNTDAFSMQQLTQTVEKIPYKPQLLGSLGIFDPEPIRTEIASIEKRGATLALVQTSERGAPLGERSTDKRDIRNFKTRRLAKKDTVRAAEIQNIRAFGSETEMMQVQAEVARRMMHLRNDIELTEENQRLGAIQGIVLDADASTLDNWYTNWGITQSTEIDFELDDATTNVNAKCRTVKRNMMQAAQGAWTPSTEIHALCADDFYDALVDHAKVRETYLNWSAAADLRGASVYGAFTYGGIVFHNYRGTDDGSTVTMTAAKAKFFPVNAPGVFKVIRSPAETFEYVNTPGLPLYAMTIPDRDRNMFVDLEVYTYPLYICTRPEMLQRAKKQ